jgi:hypothetical protein
MWTRATSLSRGGLIVLCLFLLLSACAGRRHDAWTQFQPLFPEIGADTVHLASWCGKESEPDFVQHLCTDTGLASAVGLPSSSFSCHGWLRIDRRHALLIVETYTGMCGTTFYPFLATRGVDTLTLAAVPFAMALYGDGEPTAVGDNILSEQGDEVWLLDQDRDGDLDVVFSGWQHGCVAVTSFAEPGQLVADCVEEYGIPRLYEWKNGKFMESALPNAEAFLKLRLDRREGDR